jgi:hypothetical protein
VTFLPALSGTRVMNQHIDQAPPELQIKVCSVAVVSDVCVITTPVRIKAAVIVFPHIAIDTISTSFVQQLGVQDYGRPPTRRAA